MDAVQGYLEKLGGNFLVASFIPSLAFVIASIITFGPIIPERVLLRVQFLLNPLGQFGIVIILIAVIIGFTLTSLNTEIYKLFEGYVLIKNLTFFRNLELSRASKFRTDRQSLVRQIERLEKRLDIRKKAGLPSISEKEEGRIQNRILSLKTRRDDISAAYDQLYPPYDNLVLPTRLGNILRAAETYPRTRWGVDSVPMWPRIIYSASTADKGEIFLSKVDFSNDQCSYLLNASLLSVAYALMAFSASLYQYFTLYLYQRGVTEILYFIPIYPIPTVYTQRAFIYILIGIIGLAVGRYFYNASLWNVSQYGNLIRATYDLFRFDLLKSLHLALPRDNSDNEEIFLWRKVSELINIGKVNGPIYLEYSHPDEPNESVESDEK